jgi:hypothetical protein
MSIKFVTNPLPSIPLPRLDPGLLDALPKHSNLHLITDATRSVSRKVRWFQDDADDDTEWDGEACGQEAEVLYVKLDKIGSRRLELKRTLAPSDEPLQQEKQNRD